MTTPMTPEARARFLNAYIPVGDPVQIPPDEHAKNCALIAWVVAGSYWLQQDCIRQYETNVPTRQRAHKAHAEKAREVRRLAATGL